MTRDEFTALAPSVALGLLWDYVSEVSSALATVPAPKPSFPPKFDGKQRRKGGMFVWFSEMDLASLQYWHNKSAAEAASGGQYADNAAKQAKALSYWVRWRQENPTTQWRGERDRRTVTASAPSSDPEQHQWPERGESSAPSRSGWGDTEPAPAQTAIPNDDDIPF